jgi:MSHA biogenesis protein MshJ
VGTYWTQFVKAVNARKQEERVVLLLVFFAVLGYGAFVLLIEPLQLLRMEMARRITVSNTQIVEQSNLQNDINANFNKDPDSFAKQRQDELRRDIVAADAELELLYGQLIDPREMSLMLTSILQRDTTLELISLSNKPSELLLTAAPDSDAAADTHAGIELFRHGMQMVFEGNYLDTVRYLQSLEGLQSNFFWERMEYSVIAYPKARITLDIYTLSTQRGWIGV